MKIKVYLKFEYFIYLVQIKFKFSEEINQKYKELKKREIVMDEFLNNFEDTKRNETEQLYNTRKTIVNYLEQIGKVHLK